MISSMYDLGNIQETAEYEHEGSGREIYPAHPHDAWYNALFMVGTPDEINAVHEDFEDIVAGQQVIRTGLGRHDDEEAIILHFKKGRMALVPDEEIEWVRSFKRADDRGADGFELMCAYEKSWRNRDKRPKVSKVQVDINFDSDEDPDEMVAEWAAEHGVSFRLVDPHGPGGGCPVYEVTGLTEKVEAWLRGPYDADDDDVTHILG